jgi:tetratricopeptide (TPR) repeat protein
VFALQDQFTEGVVGAIEPKLQQAEVARLKHKPASNLDAYDLLLRAQQCEWEFRQESHTAALRYLEQALAIDSSYAPAMALAAYCHAERFVQGWMSDPESQSREGLRLAARAVELGKDDSRVLWMAGYAIMRLQMNLPRARELVRQSLELNPNSAVAYAIAGAIEGDLLNIGEAMELLFRAMRLSPRDPREWFITLKMAWVYIIDGRYDQAITVAKTVLNQNPRSAHALRMLAASLAKQGQLDQGVAALREALNIEPITLTKLRARLTFVDEGVWRDYAAGLRLAGLPE